MQACRHAAEKELRADGTRMKGKGKGKGKGKECE